MADAYLSAARTPIGNTRAPADASAPDPGRRRPPWKR